MVRGKEEVEPETFQVELDGKQMDVLAGSHSHLVAFVGHNGLMDMNLESEPVEGKTSPVKSAVVLACASEQYFLDILGHVGAHPLMLTTGLMCPEAYALDAIVKSWFSGATTPEVKEAAACAYDKYQHCGIGGARRLFSVTP